EELGVIGHRDGLVLVLGIQDNGVVSRDLIHAGAGQILLGRAIGISGISIQLGDNAILVDRIALEHAVLGLAEALVDLHGLDFTVDNSLVLVVVAILVMDQVGDGLLGQEQGILAAVLNDGAILHEDKHDSSHLAGLAVSKCFD
ncbi:tRNA (adenosine(37)-N6)-threonylcarbamoyltransferase complex ATPase subunit type 1 TsaE, partial [Dysosmobacter welbionis]